MHEMAAVLKKMTNALGCQGRNTLVLLVLLMQFTLKSLGLLREGNLSGCLPCICHAISEGPFFVGKVTDLLGVDAQDLDPLALVMCDIHLQVMKTVLALHLLPGFQAPARGPLAAAADLRNVQSSWLHNTKHVPTTVFLAE